MPIDNLHPDYPDAARAWEQVRDAAAGEIAIKKKAERYLKMPGGFAGHEDSGQEAYDAYLSRSKFPEIVSSAIRGMVGLIHRKPAQISLPAKLEPMFERATPDGASLNRLHERITSELLATGRYGLLADFAADGEGDLPFIAGYAAESIINWSAAGDFIVLDETAGELDQHYEWNDRKQFRELRLMGDQLVTRVYTGQALENESVFLPQAKFGRPIGFMPFTVIGSTDITPNIDEVPILPVARSAIAAYQLYADYRHQLFYSGQATLVLYAGIEKDKMPTITGSGVILGLPQGAKAEYVSPDGKTIEAHRQAILDEYAAAMAAGGRLLDTERKTAESGDALRRRMMSQTASIVSIALNSAKGLQQALRHCAVYVDADPDEIVIEPNLEFSEQGLQPGEIKALLDAWMAGAISRLTLYERFQRGDVASTERDFDEEQELIAGETELPNVVS